MLQNLSAKQIGIAALLFMTLIWGGTFVVIKISLNDISSMLFLGIRFLIAGLILLLFVYKRVLQTPFKDILRGSLLGLFLFIAFATQTIGLKYTTATKSSFITGTVVIIIPLFQIIMERKKPSKGTVIGTFLVLIGLVFLSAKDTPMINFFNELGSNFNVGDLFTFACALIFSVHIVYLDIISKSIDFMVLVFLQILVTTILAFIMSSVFSETGIEPVMFKFSDSLIFGILYTSILATILTTILQTKYQKEVTPAKAGIIYSFEPIFAGTFAIMILNEDLYTYGIIGSLLIFIGLLLSELLERKRKNDPASGSVEYLEKLDHPNNCRGLSLERAEILAAGMVQGVGFRYFVYTNAQELGLKGYTKNLYSGEEVLTVVEGERALIEELFKKIRIGPRYASVNKCTINWKPYKNEFKSFEIIH